MCDVIKNTSTKGSKKEEVRKEPLKKEMDNRRIFMTLTVYCFLDITKAFDITPYNL